MSEIRAGERVCIAGLPGKGKTNLEMALCEGQGSVVVLDCKRDPKEWPAYARSRGYQVTSNPDEIAQHARVVYEVPSLALDDREGWDRPGTVGFQWTLALMRCFERGPTLIVFAEAALALPSSAGNPHARRILREGRSRGLTSLYDVQRVIWVDTFAPRLAEHMICFEQPPDDLVLLRKLRGVDPKPLSGLGPFQFGYHRLGAAGWEICDPVERILGPASRPRKGRRGRENGAAEDPDGAETDPAP